MIIWKVYFNRNANVGGCWMESVERLVYTYELACHYMKSGLCGLKVFQIENGVQTKIFGRDFWEI